MLFGWLVLCCVAHSQCVLRKLLSSSATHIGEEMASRFSLLFASNNRVMQSGLCFTQCLLEAGCHKVAMANTDTQ